MDLRNIKIGDILVFKKVENNAKVIVVGSVPSNIDGNVSFKAVLKENRREVFKLSNTDTIINASNNDVIYIIGNMASAIAYNANNVFGSRLNQEFISNVNNKISMALRKKAWLDTNVINPSLSLEESTESTDTEAEAPAPVMITSAFTVTIVHQDSELPLDLLQDLTDAVSDQFGEYSVNVTINE